ncbi:hypothetical protein [Cupriavidus pauculus]|uniref:hypothetical protein n=1 Tax=Cupriavidus pauculus TaxID=82633 RepID=UPI0011AFBF2D|nr:hypothetical protein [Cupriavidus pauculus]
MARIIISIAPRVGEHRRIHCNVTGAWRGGAEPIVALLALTMVADNMFAVAPVPTSDTPDTCLASFDVLTDIALPCATAMESTLCFLGLDARFTPPGGLDDHR